MVLYQNSKRKGNSSRILEEVKKFEYISFDIFDTLIKRNVKKPTDVFYLLETLACREFGETIQGFRNIRIGAEIAARKTCGKEEINLDDIYSQMKGAYSPEIIVWLKKKEIELELRLCERNSDFFLIYDYCVQNKKKIIIISDMYLPKYVIEQILLNCGINIWDRLYVSCEYGLTKSSGKLFEHVIQSLNTAPGNVFHIGDNKRSDYKMPIASGMHAVLYFKNPDCSRYPNDYNTDIFSEICSSFISNTICSIDENNRLGYECFGPLLFGFCQWLVLELRNNGIHKVYFFSRDGLILKKAFDVLNSGNEFTTDYFYASRRALRLPVISLNYSFQEFVSRIRFPEVVSVKMFISLFGINDKNTILRLAEDYDFEYSVKSNTINNDETFRNLYSTLMDIVENDSIDEKNVLIEYISQEGMEGRFAIVDIGWHGNMQLDLETILNASKMNHETFGYYIGVDPFNNHKQNIRMKGYLFDENKGIENFEKEKAINSLFELIFTAQHGSVIRYQKISEKGIIPILSNMEQTNELDAQPLWDYQNGALQFVGNVKKYRDLLLFTHETVCDRIFKQFQEPTLVDAQSWKNLVFKDIAVRKLCYTESFRTYLFSPQKFLRDYKKSVWKQGFLKIIFKKNLNYNKMSKSITRIKNKFNR